jgi:hypothetical protein
VRSDHEETHGRETSFGFSPHMTLLLREKPPFRRTRDYSAHHEGWLFLPFGTGAPLAVSGTSIAAHALRVSLLHFHVKSMAPLQQFPQRPVTPPQQFPSRPVTPPTPSARHGALVAGSHQIHRSTAFRPGSFPTRIIRFTPGMPCHLFSFHSPW